jgi:hypothetical protein
MSEYIDLIQMEKEEALQDYHEDTFRMQLDREIAKKTTSTRSYVHWFQKPAIAGSSVLFLILLAWLSKQFMLPSFQASEEMHLKNTLVQMFSQHENILNRNPLPIDSKPEKSANLEFEWSVKRVILAIQREKAQDEDITQHLSRVLQESALLKKVEGEKSGEFNI